MIFQISCSGLQRPVYSPVKMFKTFLIGDQKEVAGSANILNNTQGFLSPISPFIDATFYNSTKLQIGGK
jgi:hypothetical protein